MTHTPPPECPIPLRPLVQVHGWDDVCEASLQVLGFPAGWIGSAGEAMRLRAAMTDATRREG